MGLSSESLFCGTVAEAQGRCPVFEDGVCPIAENAVAKIATAIQVFALAISTGILMLQVRTEFANAKSSRKEYPMRSIVTIMLPIIAAAGLSGLMFSATLV